MHGLHMSKGIRLIRASPPPLGVALPREGLGAGLGRARALLGRRRSGSGLGDRPIRRFRLRNSIVDEISDDIRGNDAGLFDRQMQRLRGPAPGTKFGVNTGQLCLRCVGQHSSGS